MHRTSQQLRDDALSIWQAGVDAVAPARLMREFVRLDGNQLTLGDDEPIDLRTVQKIAVVGAGKAAAGMTTALEQLLGPEILAEKQVAGWVNVPADCVVPTERIHLHAGRPAGVNEPRPEGVAGTREILGIVESLTADDLCICLLAGGGSALLVAPVPEISLDEKIAVTRLISAAGGNIEQLNTVRRQISRVKGGGLARACRAGSLVTLILSDVLGDPLDTIASGPTTPSTTTPQNALNVLTELAIANHPDAQPIVKLLTGEAASAAGLSTRPTPPPPCPTTNQTVTNHIIGNNATAVDAAGIRAEQLGYSHAMFSATSSEGPAEDVGRHLAAMALRMRDQPGPDCLITGGEPTVLLADAAVRGKGGRNQQLVLAALPALGDCQGVALLSGGTDGEDGPTDAAGAFVNEQIAAAATALRLDAGKFLKRNDAYRFFDPVDGLIKTGPTHTNVCDIRVVTVSQNLPDD
jgi:hydroxypyruvate reductase